MLNNTNDSKNSITLPKINKTPMPQIENNNFHMNGRAYLEQTMDIYQKKVVLTENH